MKQNKNERNTPELINITIAAGTYLIWGVLVGGAWCWGGATLGDFRQNPNIKQPKLL